MRTRASVSPYATRRAAWQLWVGFAVLYWLAFAGVATAGVTATPVTFTPVETLAFTGDVATFTTTDPSPVVSNYSATINWGDGTTTAGTITGPASGVFTVSGSHTYAEDGAYGVFIIVHDAFDNSNAAVTSAANVGEAVLSLTSGPNLTGTVGKAFVGTLATFNDPGTTDRASEFIATIDWGDGTTTPGTITGSGGNFTVLGTHTYTNVIVNGSYQVTMTEPNLSTLFTLTVGASVNISAGSVTPPAVTVAPLTVGSPPFEGTAFTGAVATFTTTDPSPVLANYSATINWGDGTTTAGTITGPASGVFTVSGSHTYAEDGAYGVFVTVHDALDNSDAAATSTANVGENEFVLAVAGNINITEGSLFAGPVATFNDPGSPDLASEFIASIIWGDGTTTPGTISGSGGNFTVLGAHTYTDEMSGAYQVTVSEPSVNFTLGPVSAPVTVTEADVLSGTMVMTGAISGVSFSGPVATFTDTYTGNAAGDFTATIDWGDGSTTAGTVSGGGGTYGVSGTHAYTPAGNFTVSVTLRDDAPGTAAATAAGTIQVTPMAVPALDPWMLLVLSLLLGGFGAHTMYRRRG